MPVTANKTSDYIHAWITWLDLIIGREVLHLRLQSEKLPKEKFSGLYISDNEVAALLENSFSAKEPFPPDQDILEIDRHIEVATRKITEIEEFSRENGVILPLVHLSGVFGLSDFERKVQVLGLAVELDLKYERLFGYLQDDITKKHPTVALAIRLLCPDQENYHKARSYFEPDKPLLWWELISLNEDPGTRRPPLLARFIKLDDRIVSFLLGSSSCDSRLAPFLAQEQPDHSLALTTGLIKRLEGWAKVWCKGWDGNPPLILFHGRYGTGKRAAAAYLAAALNAPLILLNLEKLARKDTDHRLIIRLAEREALLGGGILCWTGAETWLSNTADKNPGLMEFFEALAGGLVPVVLLSDRAWEPAGKLSQRFFLALETPEPDYAGRKLIWQKALGAADHDLSEIELEGLSGRYRLTAGQILDALARASILAWSRDPFAGKPQVAELEAACRAQAQPALGALAKKILPRYTWNDIVLPPWQLKTLKLLCSTIRHRSMVYGDWGFDRKFSLGKGVIALFSGPSGTGKTMSAEIIANDLGLELFRIDLSAVVNKYIGETEKNLERIFSDAQGSDSILFFDEADALFGKRSEVKDAHDRYANIETAFLLQRVEEYNGLVILASNLKKNMDEAFVRRLHFSIDFPFPEETERLEIWRRSFPAEVPRLENLDLEFLAQKYKITGGNIRNIVLTSAFLAAEDKLPLSMQHILQATNYEYHKMGKLVVEADPDKYLGLAR